MYVSLIHGMTRLVAAGASPERAGEAAATALGESLEKLAPSVVDELVRSSPRMLRGRDRARRWVRRRIRSQWGGALDLFTMLLVAAEESGQLFDRQHRPQDGEWFDPLADVLLGLHARACRAALEVHNLLSGGLPKGALARSRTLHEVAVCAMVLAEYGRRPQHRDLAERFIDHAAVTTYNDALTFQENCEVLGYERFSDDEMAEMKAERDAVVAHYGAAFKKTYGWAAGLDHPGAPTFRDLERLAEVSHLRSYYIWATHEVHSDAKGWTQNVSEWGETLYRETSYSNEGLADPGRMALVSLHQTTVSLLFSLEDLSPQSMLAAIVMSRLLDMAFDAFGAAEDAVERANRRLQRRQARWGRPYRTWRRLTTR